MAELTTPEEHKTVVNRYPKAIQKEFYWQMIRCLTYHKKQGDWSDKALDNYTTLIVDGFEDISENPLEDIENAYKEYDFDGVMTAYEFFN